MSALVLESGRRWGEVAVAFQREDAAAIFDASGARWHFETRPRGGSKSTDAAGVALVWLATEAPAGARGYIVAVDSDQAGLLVDAAAGLTDRTPALQSALNVQALKIAGRSGASVEVLSADGASAFGLRPHLVVIEEFAQWPETRNSRRLWTAILSAMGKVPGSRLVILTSAGEPGHFAYKVLEEARRSDRWRTSEVPGPLPWVDPVELEAQRPLLRDSEFARLHLNQWTQSEDRLVSVEDLEAAAVLDGPQAPQAGVRYVVTLDVGLTKDACVVVVAHAEPLGEEYGAPRRVIVDRLMRWQGSRLRPVKLGEVEQAIEQASSEYHGAPLHADPYQAVGLLQRLRSKGVRASEFTFSAQSVGRVANALHLALRNRLLLLPDDPDLLAELGRVRLREISPGAVRLDHDSGEHDDQAVAIAIAVAVLQGEPQSGAAWLEVWSKEAERDAEPEEQIRREHRTTLGALPRFVEYDRPIAGPTCRSATGPRHRFQREETGDCCMACGAWRAPDEAA
jgi:phage terminase large subunit-like protein